MATFIEPAEAAGLGEGYHSAQVTVDVRLNTNESPEPPPAEFLAEVERIAASIDWHRYPDRGAAALRSALADLHGVRPDQVFCANGSNEVLQTLFLTYGGPGRTAAMFEPTYALHSHIAHVTRTEVAQGERGEDFALDLTEVKRVLATADPALTFLCSPNNPTGRVEPRPVVEEVLGLAPGLLVVDEAYGQFASWSALDLVAEDVPLVVVRTFSKTWSLAALRLGYLVAPSVVVAELEKRVLPYHLDSFKQAAGVAAVRHTAAMEQRVARLVEQRGRIVAAFAELPVESWPSEANFVLFRPTTRDAGAVWQGLVDRSVLVRDCSSWDRLGGCLRVTVGTADETTRFLTALQEVLA